MNEEVEAAPPRRVKKKVSKKSLWIAAVAAVVLVAGALTFFLLNRGPAVPAPVKKATFPAYYPTDLPGSYKVETEKISYDPASGVLFMSVNNVYDHRISVTQQAMPSKLTFDKLKGNGELIDGIDGKAAVSAVEGRIVSTMVGKENQTLILINTTKATKEEVASIIRSLHPIKR
jgi:hypothetical protein